MKNTYSTVTLIPEMKSGTPKTDAFIKYYDQVKLTKCWSIKQFSKAFFKKNFMAPFYGWGSAASRLEPLQGGSLLFTT